MKHTKGPIEYTKTMGKRPSHLLIGHGTPPYQIAELNGPNKEANGKRLRDCWNACEGINPEAVPALLEALKKTQAALRGAREMLRDIAPIEYALDSSEAAISKATP